MVLERWTSPDRKRLIYSDLRTYLIIPVGYGESDARGIIFQEYLPQSSLKVTLAPFSATLAERSAKRYIESYSGKRGCSVRHMAGDFGDARHRFLVDRQIALTDVSFEVNYKP